jgi:hypothetical protein
MDQLQKKRQATKTQKSYHGFVVRVQRPMLACGKVIIMGCPYFQVKFSQQRLLAKRFQQIENIRTARDPDKPAQTV